MPATGRTATVAAAWLGAVAVATGIGLAAVGLLGAGDDPGQRVLTAEEVAQQLAELPPPATPAPVRTTVPAPTSAPPPPADGPEVIPSAGGTVVARCVDGRPVIDQTSPAQGFSVYSGGGDDGGSSGSGGGGGNSGPGGGSGSGSGSGGGGGNSGREGGDDSDDDSGGSGGGSDEPGRVRFESDGTRVEVRVDCTTGRPIGTIRVDD